MNSKEGIQKYISPSSNQFFAFNVWDVPSAVAVIDAAARVGIPIILQTSMKAFSRLAKKEFREFVKEYSERNNIAVFLHLDHCKEKEFFKEAISAGWDSVMIDASEKPLPENICITNEICDFAHKHDALVEAEIGHIAGVEDDVAVVHEGIADIKSIEQFIKSTSVDFLAPAIGTAHGMYRGLPNLHYDLLARIKEISDIPLVIHGGTGLSDEVFKKLLSYTNVKKINISTDIKQAYRLGIIVSQHKSLLEKNGFDPLKVISNIHDCIEETVLHYLNLQKKEA